MHNQIFDEITNQYRDYFPEMPLRLVVVDSGLGINAKDIIKSLDIGKSFLLVSDKDTYEALGYQIDKSLSGFKARSLIFKNKPFPDKKHVEDVRSNSKCSDVIIAIGSGTINDICKYVSYLENKPYIVFGTAPSMNGYSSANASITIDGHKKTLKAQLPTAILLDIDVLASAPKRLIRSGLGDSLCRSTAQADWLLSNLVLGTDYKEIPFDILKDSEAVLLENSGGIVSGDKETIKILADTLILSGLGMFMCGGSYPASQGEHMIAHTMEMVYGHNLPMVYHGEQIGVTTLTMAKLQEELLSSTPVIGEKFYNKAKIIDFFGREVGNQCLAEYENKISSLQKIKGLNEVLVDRWPDCSNKIRKNMISYTKIKESLLKAGCHISCEEIGWSLEDYLMATKYAKYSRDRFTFLDLV